MSYKHSLLSITLMLICANVGAAQNTSPNAPCPREIVISSPFTINEGDPLTFAVEGSDTSSLSLQLKYVWTLIPASVRLMSGAGTPSITVETTKMNGKLIMVGLVVEGVSKQTPCRVIADASTIVVAPRTPAPPLKFADFPSTSFDRDKEQLDRLATFLRNSPEAGAYIIAYGGRRGSREQAARLAARAREYLLKSSVISSIDPSWIVAASGGHRESDTYELWVVPRGSQPPPTIRPVSTASKLLQRKKSAARTRRER